MKKLLSVFLILCVLLSVSRSYAADMYARFTIYGSTEGTGSVFDGDTFALDLYITNDFTAYIQQTVWKGIDASTSIRFASVQTRTNDSKNLYFVFADGSYYTGHYDETYGYMFWLDLPGGSIKLEMSEEFYNKTDFIGE